MSVKFLAQLWCLAGFLSAIAIHHLQPTAPAAASYRPIVKKTAKCSDINPAPSSISSQQVTIKKQRHTNLHYQICCCCPAENCAEQHPHQTFNFKIVASLLGEKPACLLV
jgi:hypothetical protein